jgi:hypothetical protein
MTQKHYTQAQSRMAGRAFANLIDGTYDAAASLPEFGSFLLTGPESKSAIPGSSPA